MARSGANATATGPTELLLLLLLLLLEGKLEWLYVSGTKYATSLDRKLFCRWSVARGVNKSLIKLQHLGRSIDPVLLAPSLLPQLLLYWPLLEVRCSP
jgi:hypothetical protein